ncbi:hypothetical protein KQX54_006972 [Cotesia glomerata]|uniref:Uncharacterized protein n=1 Tax=Cotesia glomerata TaxID=32391 RepID=A0AAV7J2Y6_COTGL|nr:hypothetical protein KQX54_006972 [Cotesia glomerata]
MLQHISREQDADREGRSLKPKAGGCFLIKTKKGYRFLECNISTDSFGGNISCREKIQSNFTNKQWGAYREHAGSWNGNVGVILIDWEMGEHTVNPQGPTPYSAHFTMGALAHLYLAHVLSPSSPWTFSPVLPLSSCCSPNHARILFAPRKFARGVQHTYDHEPISRTALS